MGDSANTMPELRAGDRIVSLDHALHNAESHAALLYETSQTIINTYGQIKEVRQNPLLEQKIEDTLTDILAEQAQDYTEAISVYAFDLACVLDYLHSQLPSALPGKIARVGAELGREAGLRQGVLAGEVTQKPKINSRFPLLHLASRMEELEELRELGLDPEPSYSKDQTIECIAQLGDTYEELKTGEPGIHDNEVIRLATEKIVQLQIRDEHALMPSLSAFDEVAA